VRVQVSPQSVSMPVHQEGMSISKIAEKRSLSEVTADSSSHRQISRTMEMTLRSSCSDRPLSRCALSLQSSLLPLSTLRFVFVSDGELATLDETFRTYAMASSGTQIGFGRDARPIRGPHDRRYQGRRRSSRRQGEVLTVRRYASASRV